MNLRVARVILILSFAPTFLPAAARADAVRREIHLQSLSGLRQAVNRIPTDIFQGSGSRTLLLQRLDELRTSITQDQFLAAAGLLERDILPTLDGTGAVPDVLPASLTKSNLAAALEELHDVLRSEASLGPAGQSNTRIREQRGILSYRRLNGTQPLAADTPLLGAQFFPFWRGFTEPDPDGTCRSPGDDSASGCLADPAVVNGDNQRTIALDRLGTPARTVPWSYEFAIDSEGYPNALTSPWTTFLQSADKNQVNLVRVFASYTLIPELGGNYFPWQVQAGVLQVRDAICDDHWDERSQTGSEGYFDRLRALIAAADAKGVAVQFTLFVRQEIDPTVIPLGTWSREASDVASGSTFTCNDGQQYAMPRATQQESATINFFSVEDGAGLTPLGRVQRLFIRKLVREALLPSADVPTGFTNVVFEVMNEPISRELRPVYPTQAVVRRWQSFVIRTIRETEAELRQSWPALPPSVLSLNAVPTDYNATKYDEMDLHDWRRAQDLAPGDPVLAQLDEVGLVNYHGYFSAGVLEEDLSLQGLEERLAAHVAVFGEPGTDRALAALLSTDGVRIGAGDAAAPSRNDPLSSTQEGSTCTHLAASQNANGNLVDLDRSNCRIAMNVGPCSPDAPNVPIGPECATAHGVPGLLRVYRTGYRNGVVTGANFALTNFIEDLGRRVITGAGLHADPRASVRAAPVPRVPGAYHFHNQSPFEDAMKDMSKVPRPVQTVPLDEAAVLLILGVAFGLALARRPRDAAHA